MPAQSRAQQQAAGIALAAKRGDIPKSKLRGASASMAKMRPGELKKFAKTKSGGLPKHVKEVRASRIVSTLLEDGPPAMQRVCAACEKELGVRRTANITHGLCQRHTIEYFGERGRAQVQRRPPEDFAPDLAQQQQQVAPPKASFSPNPGYAA